MPPKVKVTGEEIVSAALTLVREHEGHTINARNLAAHLQCSTQPIFSNFATMNELRNAVIAKAAALYMDYTRREVESDEYPTYKATGMAYIRFAKEEPELFKLLFMRDRTQEDQTKHTDDFEVMISMVQQNLGLSEEKALLFHLEMWVCVHGIATMMATSYLNIEEELVSRMLSDYYLGLKNRFPTEE